MISIESFSSVNYKASPLNIPKPSGLEVGDLMIYIVNAVRSSFYGIPAGWTEILSSNYSINSYWKIYKKIATIDDVNASTYDFSLSSSTYWLGGIIYRIKNGDFDNVNIGVPTTPIVSNSILLAVGMAYDGDSDTSTFSGYSITGGVSPTFTENHDSSGGYSSYRGSLGVASAIYSSLSEITAYNVTVDSTTQTYYVTYLITIGEKEVLDTSKMLLMF